MKQADKSLNSGQQMRLKRLASYSIGRQQKALQSALSMSLVSAGELRLSSGSKNEPPSRPQVEWSKQKPYFGTDLQRDVSVELGKSAYLTCRVFERGDKTVSKTC